MKILTRLRNINGDLTIDQLEITELNMNFFDLIKDGNGEVIGEMTIHDSRIITPLQRRFIYAIIRDIANHTGDDVEWLKGYLKYNFMVVTDFEEFSLSNCEKFVATAFSSYLLDFVFKHDIPIKLNTMDYMQDNQKFYYCLKYRRCCICGDKADVDHVDTVGMGNNRRNIDHTQHRFLALCRKHHNERHNIGVSEFIDKYKVVPIKLKKETLVRLGIQKQSVGKDDEAYSYVDLN